MEVANTTKTDTEYRTGSGNPRLKDDPHEVWVVVKAGTTVVIPDPSCPFTVHFVIGDEVVSTPTCEQPLRRISLVRTGPRYGVRRFKLQKPPQPTRRSPLPAGDGQQKQASRA